jgi:3,4-dihydroxy 2-butanone 4-phosphate synthase
MAARNGRRARERLAFVMKGRVSRSGAKPGPTVTVRMKEDVRRDFARSWPGETAFARPGTFFANFLCEERFMSELTSIPVATRFAGIPAPRRIARALQALRAGSAVLLLDDDDRENEADLIVAAERLSAEMMALLIRECSGIVCLCLDDELLQRLQLPPMVSPNRSRYGTAFTISIEARHGVGTGVSAADRVTTIHTAIADAALPEDLVSPGHVFPLRAETGGVLARRGHTEGAVDLVRLAGLKPAAVLCELMNRDGTMARGDQVLRFAKARGFPLLTIAELVTYRLQADETAMAPQPGMYGSKREGCVCSTASG